MRISDWSSDVCSSDLPHFQRPAIRSGAVMRALEHSGPDRGAAEQREDDHISPVGQIAPTGGAAIDGLDLVLRRQPETFRTLPTKPTQVIGRQVIGKTEIGQIGKGIDRKSTRLNYSGTCAPR